MADVRLSEEADADLEEILYFGAVRFGRVQAHNYLQELKAAFNRIAAAPVAYQAVDDLRPGYRRAVYQSHAIYFRVEADGVLIVRVLGQQDTANALSDTSG